MWAFISLILGLLMQFDTAVVYLKQKFQTFNNVAGAHHGTNGEIIQEALRLLLENNVLEIFEESHLDALYRIEEHHNGYFPGLSRSAATNICTLYKANPNLNIDFLIDVATRLSSRSRPWESLSAINMIAEIAPKQMTEEKINWLLTRNSNYLEIASHDLRKQYKPDAYDAGSEISAFITRTWSSFFKPEPNLEETFNTLQMRFGGR